MTKLPPCHLEPAAAPRNALQFLLICNSKETSFQPRLNVFISAAKEGSNEAADVSVFVLHRISSLLLPLIVAFVLDRRRRAVVVLIQSPANPFQRSIPVQFLSEIKLWIFNHKHELKNPKHRLHVRFGLSERPSE